MAELASTPGYIGGFFGVSVSISSDTLIVGAYKADPNGQEHAGAAYVFYRNQGGPDAWGQVAALSAGGQWAYFGYSVSVDGDTAVVGADGADGSHGVAYVFYRNQGGPDAWGQVAVLSHPDARCFGCAVSLSGETAVVGAPLSSFGGHGRQGTAYIFYRNQGGPDAWGEVAELAATHGRYLDGFGDAVSISGDTAFVGAPGADVARNMGQGAAYAFSRNQGGADAWGQVARLTAADGAADDEFGTSVSVDGDSALVGVPIADVGGNICQGAAYVFRLDTTLHLRALLLDWAYGTQPGTYHVSATVRVHDQNEARAPEVTVYGDWTLPDGTVRHRTEVTNSIGRAQFSLWVTHTGSYQLCVTDLVKTGYGYDPGANEVPACGSVVVGP